MVATFIEIYMGIGLLIALLIVAAIKHGLPPELEKEEDFARIQHELDLIRLQFEAAPEIVGPQLLFVCVFFWLPYFLARM